tara:strand:- start:281 stop:448 length:168 start_codon:yes stop_codon:yes gene_type:complete
MFAFIIDIFGIVSMVVFFASLIAMITPTPKDNAFLGKAYKLIDFLALNMFFAKDK